jgi:hypothetical protein
VGWEKDNLILLLVHDLDVPNLFLEDVDDHSQVLEPALVLHLDLCVEILKPFAASRKLMFDLLLDDKHVEDLQDLLTKRLLLEIKQFLHILHVTHLHHLQVLLDDIDQESRL